MKETPIVTINEDSNPVIVVSLFYGVFLIIALFSFVNPFFRHLLIFLSVLATITSVMGCFCSYDDKKNGIKRSRPKRRGVFPKWTFHVFFAIMIAVTAGLELGYYIIPVCWVISWVMLHSGIQHIKATYEDKEK